METVTTATTVESLDTPSTCGKNVFEGVEKRFELTFAVKEGDILGLRAIPRESWDSVCSCANCLIIHHESKPEFDSYILSESSLFVFRDRVMMKTCGTTVPLAGADHLVRLAREHQIPLVNLIYSRSSFLFQHLQEYPHHDDKQEIEYLNTVLLAGEEAVDSKTYILGNPEERYWLVHQKVFMEAASSRSNRVVVDCIMSGLHLAVCDKFFRDDQMSVAENEIEMSRYVSHVLPDFKQICAKSFDRCGYSCNAHDPIRDIAGDRYFTIHITPEEAFSYASVEAVFHIDEDESTIDDIKSFIKRVAATFEPENLSVAVITPPGVELSSDDMESGFDVVSEEYTSVSYSRSAEDIALHQESEPMLCGYQGSYVTYNVVHDALTI